MFIGENLNNKIVGTLLNTQIWQMNKISMQNHIAVIHSKLVAEKQIERNHNISRNFGEIENLKYWTTLKFSKVQI